MLVRVRGWSALDRIGAVGGTLEVISPSGGGTREMASIPCRRPVSVPLET